VGRALAAQAAMAVSDRLFLVPISLAIGSLKVNAEIDKPNTSPQFACNDGRVQFLNI